MIHESLADSLRRLAALWNRTGALTVTVRAVGEAGPLPRFLEQHLVGIGTEAMTNAVKHGRAESIEVEIGFTRKKISLRIKDNGAGFDPARVPDHRNGCFGIQGMRERAGKIHGQIRIHSQSGQGTELRVEAPIPDDQQVSAE